jgi:hypothetical protein
MTSLASEPSVSLGYQQARLRNVPAYVSTSGLEATQLAASAGLHLMSWQSGNLADALGEKADGRWSAFEVAEVVSRQNGKGGEIEARELAGLFLFGEQLIVHTAHEYKTAAEAFLRIKALIENTDDLIRKCRRPRTANGEQGIELLPKFGGGRLRFLARSEGSGRGFTGDCVVLDEAYAVTATHMAALLPTLSTRPNPQVWYTSTVGGEYLGTIRARALKGDPELCYHEHSAEQRPCTDERCDHDPDTSGCFYNDRHAWAQANPSMGLLIPVEAIERERRSLPLAEFAAERLSLWPSIDGGWAVIPESTWAARSDLSSTPVGQVAFAFDVNPERTAGAIAISGPTSAGREHMECIAHEPGVDWIVDALVAAAKLNRPKAVVTDATGPGAALVPALARRGIKVTLLGAQDVARAAGGFFDSVTEGRAAHRADPKITAALAAATKAPAGDAWKFSRKDATDISPLYAAVFARHAATGRKRAGSFSSS